MAELALLDARAGARILASLGGDEETTMLFTLAVQHRIVVDGVA